MYTEVPLLLERGAHWGSLFHRVRLEIQER